MSLCNIGIVGLGGFANLILEALKDKTGFNVIAAADVDEEKAKKFKDKFDIEHIYFTAEELFQNSKVDLVIIATPPFLHYELGKQALLAGKNIFLEKPGSLTAKQMEELMILTEDKRLKSSIDFVMRRNPPYFILKQLKEKDIFGLTERAYLENYAHDDGLPPNHWFWDYEKSGGIWVEHGVHFFDLVNWLIGLPVKAKGEKFSRDIGIVDRVVGTALYENKVVVSYYHGFTKPEIFEETFFSMVFQRAYAKVEGWIPTTLVIDALVSPDTEEYIEGELLTKARKYLPGIDVTLEKKLLSEFDSSELMPRVAEYHANVRILFTFTLDRNRWDVYKACVFRGIEDLSKSILNEKTNPDVMLIDAKRALDVAMMMES